MLSPGVVADEHDDPAGDRRAAALAQRRPDRDLAELPLPRHPPVRRGDREHARRPERAIQHAAAMHRGGRREGGVGVDALVRDLLGQHAAPAFGPGLAVVRQGEEPVGRVRERDAEHAVRLVLRAGLGGVDLAGVDGGEEEDGVAGHDRGGRPAAGDGDLPRDPRSRRLRPSSPAGRRTGRRRWRAARGKPASRRATAPPTDAGGARASRAASGRIAAGIGAFPCRGPGRS